MAMTSLREPTIPRLEEVVGLIMGPQRGSAWLELDTGDRDGVAEKWGHGNGPVLISFLA